MSDAPINHHAIPMEEMAKVQWKFWQAAHKGLDYPINPKFVPWGYYRYTKKDGVSIPLAIWEDKGKKYYRFGSARIEPMGNADQESAWGYNVFQHVSRHPISKAEYQHWMENKRWPDEHGVIAAVEASKPAPAAPPPAAPAPATPAVTAAEAVIGHNSGETEPLLTPEDALGRVKVVIEAAKKFTEIKTQDEANASMLLSDRLRELANEADARRDTLKRPHLDAGRAVDEAWNPVVIKPAKDEASRLGTLRGAFAAAETKRRREEAAAEQARLDAEALAARAAAPAGESAPAEPRKVVEAAPVSFQATGGGRKSKAKAIRQAKILDQQALYDHVKHYDGVKTALQDIANKIYYAGGQLPGCEENLIYRG